MELGSLLATLSVVALVPGYAYLRLAESGRRPRIHSALEETLEVVASGVLTTGLAVAAALLLFPSGIHDKLKLVNKGDPAAIRTMVLALLAIAGAALILAVGLAWLTRKLGKQRFSPAVWAEALKDVPKGQIVHVAVELLDGRRVDGALSTYTVVDRERPRDIALRRPLQVTANGSAHGVDAEFFVVGADQIRWFWVAHQSDPGSTD